jgi:MFS family permease
MASTFASLSVYNYRSWFIGALFGNTGTWMQRVAQDWIVLTLYTDNDAFAVGVITAIQFAPSLFITPFGGVLADRLNRRKVLLATQSAQAVLAFALGALMLTGHMNLVGMYIFAGLAGSVAGLEGPFFQTFVGQLVGPKLLANAVGLNSANFNAARMVGPAVAGWALAVWAPGWVFLVNGLSFVATVTALAVMRPAQFSPMPSAPREGGNLRAGLAYARKRSDIIAIFLVIAVVSCFGLNNQLTMGAMARVEFDRGAGDYGILGSLFAVGALLGSLLAARRPRPRVRLVLGAAMAFAVAQGFSAIAPTYQLYAASGVLVGFCTLTLITACNSTLQLSVPAQVRGRVMALYMVFFLGPTPVGSPFVGWVADAWGPRWSVGVGAIASALVAGAVFVWTKTRWNVTVKMDHLLPPHFAIANPVAGADGSDGTGDAASDASDGTGVSASDTAQAAGDWPEMPDAEGDEGESHPSK